MIKTIYILLFSLCFQVSSGQTLKTTDIPGKWVFDKYTETINDKVVERMKVDMIDIYIFSENGTYQRTSKSGKQVYGSKGKWKVTDNGLKVRLYDNSDVPNNPDIEIGDHDLHVNFLKGNHYLTYTSRDLLNGPRIDYFKKLK